MDSMFKNATNFNQDINTKSVTRDELTYLAWDVSNVVRMNNMFSNTKFFNNDISSWNVSNIIVLQAMFSEALSFIKRFNDNKPLPEKTEEIKLWFEENRDNMMAITFNDNLSKEEKVELDNFFDGVLKDNKALENNMAR